MSWVAKLVDANSGFPPGRAIRVGMLADEGITHFEEPCPYWEFEQTRAVVNTVFWQHDWTGWVGERV